VNSFTPGHPDNDHASAISRDRDAWARLQVRKNPYQLSKIDGDIEKSSDFISEIVRRRPFDYSSARGCEPTPPVPGIQHDRSCMEDF
jgi:hypothetical protein